MNAGTITNFRLDVQVECVGDAYMVVSGIPDPLVTHAERIANTALGMLLATQEVMSPYDYGDGTKNVKVNQLLQLFQSLRISRLNVLQLSQS